MSEETAAERIVRQWRAGPLEAMPPNILLETAQRLQTDNERLRAREAALVAFAQAVASDHEHKFRYEDRCKHCGIDRSEWSADIQRQARALLAASEPTDATTAE